MNPVEVIVTGPTAWIERCANDLLEAKLVACAQMWEIHSRYWWDGEIEEASEVRIAMHTIDRRVDAIKEYIATSHPYDVACFTVTELLDVAEDYAEWTRVSVEG